MALVNKINSVVPSPSKMERLAECVWEGGWLLAACWMAGFWTELIRGVTMRGGGGGRLKQGDETQHTRRRK